jgi:hypothetical protein
MYLVHVMNIHKQCTIDTGIVSRYRPVARLHLFVSFVPTPCRGLVVYVTFFSVIVIVTTYALVTFYIEHVCTDMHGAIID